MSSDLVTALYEKLENKILKGEIPDGTVITEQGTAKEYNVSRTPVREVFSLLYANDYIVYDNKNARVRAFTHKDILDIYDLRIMMEGLSAGLCALNITSENLSRLQETVLLQEMYLSQKNTEKLLELDNLFHEIINSCSGNRLLNKMLGDFHKYTKFTRKASFETEGRSIISVAEHKEIFNAISERNQELAEELMKNHAVKVKENIEKFFSC